MTKAEKIDLMIAHAQAAADMGTALVEQLRGLKLDSALQSLVHIRHRHDRVAGFVVELMPPPVRERKKTTLALEETCSSPTSPTL